MAPVLDDCDISWDFLIKYTFLEVMCDTQLNHMPCVCDMLGKERSQNLQNFKGLVILESNIAKMHLWHSYLKFTYTVG